MPIPVIIHILLNPLPQNSYSKTFQQSSGPRYDLQNTKYIQNNMFQIYHKKNLMSQETQKI